MDLQKIFNSITNLLKNKELTLYNCQHILDNDDNDIDLTNYQDLLTVSDKNYTRNLVYTNNQLDCYLLCWLPGQNSPYHFHPDRGCIYKVLKGELTEIKETIDKTKINTILYEGDSGYIDNSDGSHKMINTGDKLTISLHFYSPSGFYE